MAKKQRSQSVTKQLVIAIFFLGLCLGRGVGYLTSPRVELFNAGEQIHPIDPETYWACRYTLGTPNAVDCIDLMNFCASVTSSSKEL